MLEETFTVYYLLTGSKHNNVLEGTYDGVDPTYKGAVEYSDDCIASAIDKSRL
jgi:hypothetical protein